MTTGVDMGLFSKKVTAPQLQLAELTAEHYAAEERVKLAGLAFYQDTLQAMVASLPAPMRAQGWAMVEVEVLPEPDNAHDSGALRVSVNGHTIGYVPKNYQDTYAVPNTFDGWRLAALVTFAKGGTDTHVAVALTATPDITYS